jgi:enoyl-CoA hydratase/carnithine racemase
MKTANEVPTYENLILEIKEGVAQLKLNRPKVHHAMTNRMREELRDAFKYLKSNDEVSVILLKGEGKSFCSGADVKEVSAEKRTLEQNVDWNLNVQERARYIMDVGKPVIAVLHGWVVAGGFELALNCDIRIAAEDTKLWESELTFGGMLNNAAYQILPKIVGLGRAKEIILAAQPIDVADAEKWGLVNKVVPLGKLEEVSMEMAQRIATFPNKMAVKLSRRFLDYAIDASLERILDVEAFGAAIAESTEAGVTGMKKKADEI